MHPVTSWLEQRMAELGRLPVVLGRVRRAAKLAERSGTAPFIAWLEARAHEQPDALCCEQDEERVTYGDMRARARRAAHALVERGVHPGDVVALIAGSSPSYLATLLAIGYAGGVAALLNPDLRGEPLNHALTSVAPRLTLLEASLAELFAPGPELVAPLADPNGDFVLIFTSGTTGLPKPCRVRHERARAAATIFGSVAFEFRPGDKLYCALPLHHSSALLIGIGAALVAGVPVALRRKFSASEFASDLVRYGATATLYVGDVCRALVHSPPSAEEARVRLRVAVGNGLEAHVWREFARRYGNPAIREFYASTEAPAAIVNLTNTVGSLGHVPFEKKRGFRLARLDDERRELQRDERGRAMPAAVDEPGELLFRVYPSATDPHGAFRGYTDRAASDARLARDVFEVGDCYFRSGDLLRRDRSGYFYFVDRLGDGFRWKGENVSALEVERVLDARLGFPGVSVFGVAVPGYPGRAGFAEVVARELDAAQFAHAAAELPVHARPCFVRVVPAFDLTSSFKVKKHRLDLADAVGKEPMWVRQNGSYVVLTVELWNDLCRGQARL